MVDCLFHVDDACMKELELNAELMQIGLLDPICYSH